MSRIVDPVECDEILPAQADVVIIGGGIVGVSTALFLAQRGVSTVLCEKGVINGEQSSRNWGWCRQMGRDPREIPLIVESMRLWRTMNETVEGETGFRQTGALFICETEADLRGHDGWLEHARTHQLDSRLITGAEAARLVPGASRSWAGALYTPSDGSAEPEKAASAMATAARRHGATIIGNCAVRGLDIQGGRIAGAITEKGRIACSAVVLAGGAWSRLFCGNNDLRLPQLKVLASVMRTEKVAGPEAQAVTSKFGYRKRLDGGYTVSQLGVNVVDIVPDSFRLFSDFVPLMKIRWPKLRPRVTRRGLREWVAPRRWSLDEESPFEKVRVLDPEPNREILEQARESIGATFPAFRNVKVVERWAGMVDVTPDAVPVMSAVDTLSGFFIATGFSGHGFGIGPGAGRLMADLVTGAPPIVDPTPFRFSRFTDGSRAQPSRVAT